LKCEKAVNSSAWKKHHEEHEGHEEVKKKNGKGEIARKKLSFQFKKYFPFQI
jgi:hypothetical protein